MDRKEERDSPRQEIRNRTLTAAAAALVHAQGDNSSDVAKVTQLVYHSDPAIREGAINKLARLARREIAPHINQALNDRDYRVRAAACYALGRLRVHAAKPKLYQALSDRQPTVRCAAAVALADMGEKYGLSHVARLVCTTDEHQIEALQALNQITKQKFPLSRLGIKQAINWCKLQIKSLNQT